MGAGQAGSPVYGKPKLVQATRRIVTRKLIPRLHLIRIRKTTRKVTMMITHLARVWRRQVTSTGRAGSSVRLVNTAAATPSTVSGLPAAPRRPMIGTKMVKISCTT